MERLKDHQGIYSTEKIAWHPESLQKLREAVPQPPLIVQLMPTNVCNQACNFCSYGSGPEAIRAKIKNPDKILWKNQQLFEGRDMIPHDKMVETVRLLGKMGVKCIEVTGGGEPTAYPFFEELLTEIQQTGMEFGLVSNGTLIDEKLADKIADLNFSWVRISIDAGTPEEYVKVRNVPRSHWEKAWRAVKLLSSRKRHPEAVVGVGMVVDRDNWVSVYNTCKLAQSFGADNIRISAAFTPEGPLRFSQEILASIPEQVALAKQSFESASFKIHDLFEERRHNVIVAKQTYPFCYWKEIGCVIGADQNVYACCSWAYNRMGKMGTIRDKTIQEMWFGEGVKWRKAHDPRLDCKIHCLYERRNLSALQLMGDPAYADEVATTPPPKHVNFV